MAAILAFSTIVFPIIVLCTASNLDSASEISS